MTTSVVLKDGTKAKWGDLVRFRAGASAIMRIDKIVEDLHGKRLYGVSLCGDYHAAWAEDCTLASDADHAWWGSTSGDRSFTELGRGNYRRKQK